MKQCRKTICNLLRQRNHESVPPNNDKQRVQYENIISTAHGLWLILFIETFIQKLFLSHQIHRNYVKKLLFFFFFYFRRCLFKVSLQRTNSYFMITPSKLSASYNQNSILLIFLHIQYMFVVLNRYVNHVCSILIDIVVLKRKLAFLAVV